MPAYLLPFASGPTTPGDAADLLHGAVSVTAVAGGDGSCGACGWHRGAGSATFPGMPDELNPFEAALPAAFVWTKMQAESGQGLADIVRRKELERAAGGGQFWWGVGNALGDNLLRLVARALAQEAAPSVLFSIMRGRPKREDAAPDAVLLWTAYLDEAGRIAPLPGHVLVTSRGSTAAGDKRRHYALVCRSEQPLRLEMLGALEARHYRNLGSAAPGVGASQVTAVVEHAALAPKPEVPLAAVLDGAPGRGGAGMRYDVNLRAALDQPYFVRLTRPVLLSCEDRDAVDAAAGSEPAAWLAFVRALRARAEATAARVMPAGSGLAGSDLFSYYL